MGEAINYDYKAPSSSAYLRLRNNGESCKIRIVSEPVKFQAEYEGQIKEKYAWLVLDRADGEIRVFPVGVSIWKKISALANNPDWGDPTTYDITITRTGKSPSDFYDVAPSPNNKGDLTKAEMEKVMACDLDLINMVEQKKE